jgi:hypothetical protein
MPFVKQTLEYAKTVGKTAVSVLGDLASFCYYHKEDVLVEYERSLPRQFENMNLKAFCLYHKRDFETRFTDEQRQKLLEHHEKGLIIVS